MTDDPHNPLAPDVLGALASERARPGPDPGVRARSFARLQSAVGALEGGAGGESGEGGNGAAAPSAATNLLRLHPALVGGTGLVIGLLAGAALHAAFTPAPPVATSAAPSASVTAPVLAAPSAAPPPPAPPSAATAPATESASNVAASPAAPSGSNLTAERALLDLARAALSRGEPAAANDALNQHQKRFPRGVFREEREALGIQVLRDTGRVDEARRRATAFRARYPKSLFLSTVERVLEANP